MKFGRGTIIIIPFNSHIHPLCVYFIDYLMFYLLYTHAHTHPHTLIHKTHTYPPAMLNYTRKAVAATTTNAKGKKEPERNANFGMP